MRPVLISRVSQPFADPGGYASYADAHGPAGHHTGTDFGSVWTRGPIEGRRVRSVLDGEVVISEYNDTMGNWVGVYSPAHDLLVTYWHMQGRQVQVGQRIRAGTVVGRVGNTGNSTAAHLHVQVNRGRYFSYHGHINPLIAFRKRKLTDAILRRGRR